MKKRVYIEPEVEIVDVSTEGFSVMSGGSTPPDIEEGGFV